MEKRKFNQPPGHSLFCDCAACEKVYEFKKVDMYNKKSEMRQSRMNECGAIKP